MKRLVFILFAVALVSAATISARAQESRQVSGFNTVASSGPFNVHIKMDGNESVKVDADADIINDIETVVEGNILKIRFKDHENRHRNIQKAEIYVEAKSLNSLLNAGSGSIKVDGTIATDNFKTILSGSGNISAVVKSEHLNAVISGSGSINLSGSTDDDAHLVVTGSGEIDGKHLKAQSVVGVITGSGNIYIDAEKSIRGSITGSGNVIYSGNATSVTSHTTGSGRVTKED
jgi:hypothetical protein